MTSRSPGRPPRRRPTRRPAPRASATSSPRSPRGAAPTSATSSPASASASTSRSPPRRRPPRPIARRLAAPGLHLIAEIKRRSPSAGDIAGRDDDIVARARAYEAGGAAAISVLCEPHWFGGSIDDLRAVRAAVAIPVLAKEFVVDAAPAAPCSGRPARTSCCSSPSLHPRARLARLVERALDLGLEPLVEAHDERELERGARDRARGSSASTTATCGRSTSTRSARSASARSSRTTASSSPSPASAMPATVAALAGRRVRRRARRRGARAGRRPGRRGRARSSPAGRAAGRSGEPSRATPVRQDLRRHRRRRARSPRSAPAPTRSGSTSCPARRARSTWPRRSRCAAVGPRARPAGGRPTIVAITADVGAELIARDRRRARPRRRPAVAATNRRRRSPPIGRAGLEGRSTCRSPSRRRRRGRRADRRARPRLPGGRRRADPPRHGRRPASRRDGDARRPIARRRRRPGDAGRPSPADSTRRRSRTRSAGCPAIGVDVASGVEAAASRRRAAAQGPAQGRPVRQACPRRPPRSARTSPSRPTPVHPGLLEADDSGPLGDRSASSAAATSPRRSWPRSSQLEDAYDEIRHDPRFWAELRELLERYAGRPTPLYRADRLALRDARARPSRLDGRRRLPHRLRLYLKREDLAHTGAHKINNALGQALLTRRLGKTRVIAETGAGQHGVATATACALLGLPCVVYMGAEDIERQQPNVLRMRALGTEVRPVTSGSATLKDAINEAMRDWVTNVETTHYVLGSAMGPHPYPTIVRDLQRRIGDEAAAQVVDVEGRLPDLALACVGGGSNAIGLLDRFIGEPSVRLAVAEAAGDGIATGRHAAALAGGTPGILHGARSLMLQDRGRPGDRGPLGVGRARLPGRRAADRGARRGRPARDRRRDRRRGVRGDALAVARTEGILPALEIAPTRSPSLPRILAGTEGAGGDWPDEAVVLLGLSGRGDKDLATFGRWHEDADRPMTLTTADAPGAPAADRARTTRPAPRRIAARLRRARSARRAAAALIPYVVAGYPGRRDELPGRARRGRRRRRPARGRPAVLRPARRRRDAPARVRRRARERRHARGRASSSSSGSPPRAPTSRSCRWATRTSSSAAATAARPRAGSPTAGAAGVIVADLTPDEGGPVRGRRPRAGPRASSTSWPRPRRAGAARRDRRRSGGFLYCVSLVGVDRRARRRSRRPSGDSSATSWPRRRCRSRSGSASAGRPTCARSPRAGADGVIVASALVDALGPDGRDVERMASARRATWRLPRDRAG